MVEARRIVSGVPRRRHSVFAAVLACALGLSNAAALRRGWLGPADEGRDKITEPVDGIRLRRSVGKSGAMGDDTEDCRGLEGLALLQARQEGGGCPKLPRKGAEIEHLDKWELENSDKDDIVNDEAPPPPPPPPPSIYKPQLKLDKEYGHPDKLEKDVLNSMHDYAFREGLREGFARKEENKARGVLDGDPLADGGDEAEVGKALDQIADAMDVAENPPSVEDGGHLDSGGATVAAFGGLGAMLSGDAPMEPPPEIPEIEGEKEDVNDVYPEELVDGDTSYDDGGSERRVDIIPAKPEGPEFTTKDDNYMTGDDVARLVNGQTASAAFDPDTKMLCKFDPHFCPPKYPGSDVVLNADGFWEPPKYTAKQSG